MTNANPRIPNAGRSGGIGRRTGFKPPCTTAATTFAAYQVDDLTARNPRQSRDVWTEQLRAAGDRHATIVERSARAFVAGLVASCCVVGWHGDTGHAVIPTRSSGETAWRQLSALPRPAQDGGK